MKILICGNFINRRELESLLQAVCPKKVEDKGCWLLDVLTSPKRTTKCENELFYTVELEVVSKEFRSHIRETISDFAKHLAVALKEYRDLHIYEMPKKNDIYSCYNFLKYRLKRYFYYKNKNDQLFIRNEDSFHKKRKIYSVVQNGILFSKGNSNIGKWLFFEEATRSVAWMCS